MKSKKIGFAHSPGNSPHNGLGPFAALGEAVDLRYSRPDSCDAIVLWGGADINPMYYGEEPHPYTHYWPSDTRDERESYYIKCAMDAGVPIIGVCRGAQFICAEAGGKLIQHTTGHHGNHGVTVLDDGEEKGLSTSSCHHQMLWPWELPEDAFKVVAWTGNRSTCYEGANGKVLDTPPFDIEAVAFPKIKAFGVQGHPEWMKDSDPYVQWCIKQAKNLLEIE